MTERVMKIEHAALALAPRVRDRGTKVAVVLGSGLEAVADAAADADRTEYGAIPGFPRPTVEGHRGEVVFGRFGQTESVLLSGRAHLYEGASADEVVLPIRALALAGVDTLLLTNAAGGLSPDLAPGDIMLVTDHINLTGRNPLAGANLDELGPRFPRMSPPYDPDLVMQALGAAARAGVELRQGVYVGVLGPSYDTPAEVDAYRTLGGDVVGMSTVCESIAAVHAGMRVGCFSIVTNMAGSPSDDHAGVLDSARRASDELADVLLELISNL